jgi:hypothetical protein
MSANLMSHIKSASAAKQKFYSPAAAFTVEKNEFVQTKKHNFSVVLLLNIFKLLTRNP